MMRFITVFLYLMVQFHLCVSEYIPLDMLDPRDLMIATVVDPSSSEIIRDSLTLIRSMRLHGGRTNEATFLVCFTVNDGVLDVDTNLIDSFTELGVELRFISAARPPSIARTMNKFNAFREYDFNRFSHFLWLDADMVVFDDLMPLLRRHLYPGSIECVPDFYSYIRRYPSLNNTDLLWNRYNTLVDGYMIGDLQRVSHGHCNTGVLFFDNLSLQAFIDGLNTIEEDLHHMLHLVSEHDKKHSINRTGVNTDIDSILKDRFVDSLFLVAIVHKYSIEVAYMSHAMNYMALFEVEILEDTVTPHIVMAHLLSHTSLYFHVVLPINDNGVIRDDSASGVYVDPQHRIELLYYPENNASAYDALLLTTKPRYECSCSYNNKHYSKDSLIMVYIQEKIMAVPGNCFKLAGYDDRGLMASIGFNNEKEGVDKREAHVKESILRGIVESPVVSDASKASAVVIRLQAHHVGEYQHDLFPIYPEVPEHQSVLTKIVGDRQFLNVFISVVLGDISSYQWTRSKSSSMELLKVTAYGHYLCGNGNTIPVDFAVHSSQIVNKTVAEVALMARLPSVLELGSAFDASFRMLLTEFKLEMSMTRNVSMQKNSEEVIEMIPVVLDDIPLLLLNEEPFYGHKIGLNSFDARAPMPSMGVIQYHKNLYLGTHGTMSLESPIDISSFLNKLGLYNMKQLNPKLPANTPAQYRNSNKNGIGFVMCCDSLETLEILRSIVTRWRGDKVIILMLSIPKEFEKSNESLEELYARWYGYVRHAVNACTETRKAKVKKTKELLNDIEFDMHYEAHYSMSIVLISSFLKQLIAVRATNAETGEIVPIGQIESFQSLRPFQNILQYEIIRNFRSIRLNSLSFVYMDSYISASFYSSMLHFWFDSTQYRPNSGILFGSRSKKLPDGALNSDKIQNLNKMAILDSFSVSVEHPLLYSSVLNGHRETNVGLDMDAYQLWYILRYK